MSANPRLEPLFEQLNTAVICVDVESRICLINTAAEALLGQSRRSLMGQSLLSVLPQKEIEPYLKQCLQDDSQFTLREVELLQQQQSVFVDISIAPYSDAEQRLVVCELNQLNRITDFAKESTIRERQQSFRKVTRGLAHEIKNPLGGIRGAAQLLAQEVSDPEQAELSAIIIKEADRLARLVDRVMGPQQQLKLESVNVHQVIDHVIKVLEADSQDQLNIHRNFDPTLPEILADREQLVQVFLNITQNAVEAQPDKELVELGFNTQLQRSVTINQQQYKRVLMLQIWDGGNGVSETLQSSLFDPLVTTKSHGTGLGLSIAQEIITRHHGSIAYQPWDERSCFVVYLPYPEEQS